MRRFIPVLLLLTSIAVFPLAEYAMTKPERTKNISTPTHPKDANGGQAWQRCRPVRQPLEISEVKPSHHRGRGEADEVEPCDRTVLHGPKARELLAAVER